MGHPGQLDVVEVAALAGDEPRVLDPLDRGAEDVGWTSMAIGALLGLWLRRWRRRARRRRARIIVAAASRIAATMLW